MRRYSIAVLAVLFLASCTYLRSEVQYKGTIMRSVDSPRGRYTVIKTNLVTLQHMWESRASEELKHIGSTRDAFTDIKRREIWYATQAGLEEELHNIKSLSNLWDAHKKDMRDAYPMIRPPEVPSMR